MTATQPGPTFRESVLLSPRGDPWPARLNHGSDTNATEVQLEEPRDGSWGLSEPLKSPGPGLPVEPGPVISRSPFGRAG